MEADIILYLRHLRHDYLNTLMVVDGYLQMGNSEKARQAIDGASSEIRAEGEVLRLAYPGFALALLMAKPQLHQKGITLTLSVTTDLAGGEIKESSLKQVLAKLHSLSEQVEGYSNQWDFKLGAIKEKYCWRLNLQGLKASQLEQLTSYVADLDEKLEVKLEADTEVLLSWNKK